MVEIAGFSPTNAHGGEGWTRSCMIVSGEENMQRVLDMTTEYLRMLAELLDSFTVRTVARFKPAPRVGRSLLPDIKMREFLGFPEHHQVFSAATLGYRAVKLHSTPDRRTAVRFIGGTRA